MCKDLRAGSAIKRNRENMISFLVNIGESGCAFCLSFVDLLTLITLTVTAASATASGGSNDAPRNSEHTSETAAKSPSPTEPEGHGGMDIAEADSMEPGKHLPCNRSTAG
jgi:hypothetical protein